MSYELPTSDIPAVYIIHENDAWLGQIRTCFQEKGVPFVEWHFGKGGNIDLSSIPPEGVFWNRISPSSHNRGHRFAIEHTHAVLEWLESHNRRVVTGSRPLEFERSKVKQYAGLAKYGIKTPRTVVVTGSKEDPGFVDRIVKEAEKSFPNQSFITKHNRGGSGNGVRLFRSSKALREYVESDDFTESPDGVTLLQQYIESPNPYITRCEFVNGKFVYAVAVDASKGFNLCPADNCNIGDAFCPAPKVEEKAISKFNIQRDYSSPLLDKYEAFLKGNNMEIAGIECIVDKEGEVYSYDVNTNTNYNGEAEIKAFGGLRGAERVAQFLYEELQKLYG